MTGNELQIKAEENSASRIKERANMTPDLNAKKWEQDFYGKNVQVVLRENDCAIYRVKDGLGESVLTRYEIYPGIALVYNDVHTDNLSVKKVKDY